MEPTKSFPYDGGRIGGAATSEEMGTISGKDLQQIWKWNTSAPPEVAHCIHDLIAQTVQKQPEAPAICAWDGDLSYGELDKLSTKLAHHLVKLGVCGTIAPLCFEKSMWTTVAILSVMKAGGASVLLDPNLPEERLQSIVRQFDIQVVLSSRANRYLANRLAAGQHTVTVDEAALAQLNAYIQLSLPAVKPSDNLYLVFTSGSTGTPKGVVISHSNFSSAAFFQQQALGFTATSRVFDFVSYSFDISWSNVLHTLIAGACLCVPSEEERLSDIARSMTRLQVDLAFFTPTVARLLKPRDVSTLRTLVFAGEALATADVERWSDEVTMINAYGPAECTVFSTVQYVNLDPNSKNLSLGRGVASVTWIVDPTNHHQLVPIGSIGELLLEGPIVGQGYLASAEKTTAAFVSDPPWLRLGSDLDGIPGRRSVLYKTGDLVRYNSDGSMVYLGRKDTQVKIRGQRVELSEIEHHIRKHLADNTHQFEAVAEVIKLLGAMDPILVVFTDLNELTLVNILPGLKRELSRILPIYMIPSAYISIGKMPVTLAGKLDRQRLREVGASMTVEDLTVLTSSRRERRMPATDMEQRLQALWSSVLDIDISMLGLDESFPLIGGDSAAAIKLAGAAREQNLFLKVSDILKHERLDEMALKIKPIVDDDDEITVEPFSLLVSRLTEQEIRAQAAKFCTVDPDQVEDVFPCTPLQEGMLALTAKHMGNYVSQEVFELPAKIDLFRFRKAVEHVVMATQTLRARLINMPAEQGLVQVVVREQIWWDESNDGLDEYLQKNNRGSMGLGHPLSRTAIVQDRKASKCFFVWTIHHSLYDGWSLPILLEEVEIVYQGGLLKPPPPFQNFIKQVIQLDRPACSRFWHNQLKGASAVDIISSSRSSRIVNPNCSKEHHLSLEFQEFKSGRPLAATLRLAWAYVLGLYAGSNDVTYGVVVNGRGASVRKIDKITGATIATVPLRFALNRESTVMKALQNAQDQYIAMIPYEQFGLLNIRSLGVDEAEACNFQTMLVIQPPEPQRKTSFLKAVERRSGDRMPFSSYPLVIECNMDRDGAGVHLVASFDDHMHKASAIESLLRQYSWIIEQMWRHPELRLSDIDTLCPSDVTRIQDWNEMLPAPATQTLNSLVSEIGARHPDRISIETSWSKTSWGALEDLSSRLAAYLRAAGVGQEVLVPLSVDRTASSVIATIAILKAGGAVVNIDSTQPMIRRRAIIDETGARVVVVCGVCGDDEYASLYGGVRMVQVNDTWLESLPTVRVSSWNENCSSAAFVIFTSGSTGRPKAIVHEHRSIATSILAHGPFFAYSKTTRMLQMASCAFDIWIYEHLSTLIAGGCICIPSQDEKMNSIGGFVRRVAANAAIMTPTALRTLQGPLPCLTSICLGGEAIASDVVETWRSSSVLFNGYGPAETTICSASEIDQAGNPLATIGKALGCVFWVCDVNDVSRLAPVGTVGELAVEGAVVARGYLGDPAATSAAFLDNPPWLRTLKKPRNGRVYMSGDLVRYNEDGSLVYVSRKDNQVKLRGFRIEIDEVEYQLQALFDGRSKVVVELVHAQDSDRAQLIAFLESNQQSQSTSVSANASDVLLSPDARISETEHVLDRLSAILPSYMVPTVILPVRAMPETASGKVNRRRLREAVSSMSQETLASYHAQRTDEGVWTNEELLLRELWSIVLDLECSRIFRSDNFLRIGGDSVAAMRLVAVARERGQLLTVADVFYQPRLRDLAKALILRSEPCVRSIEPFSLLKPAVLNGDARIQAATLCSVSPQQIQDVFPCTPLQEGLLALTTKRHGDYINRTVMELRKDLEPDRFRAAWEELAATAPILRTRIVDISGQGLVQVIVEEDLKWSSSANLASYLAEDEKEPMDLGLPLARFCLVKDAPDGKCYIVWTLHHALYDAWSLALLLETLETIYMRQPTQPIAPFQSFIEQIVALDEIAVTAYWQAQFLDNDAAPFPAPRSTIYQSRVDRLLQHAIAGIQWCATGATASTMLRAAWAIISACYTNSSDIIFGAIVSGRQTKVACVERVPGPTIAVVPIRVCFDWDQDVERLLQQVQTQATDMTEFEQAGLQRIANISQSTRVANNFQTLLVVQPRDNGQKKKSQLFPSEKVGADADRFGTFTTYPLALICQIEGDGVQLSFSFDSTVLDDAQVRLIACQLEHVLRQISMPENAQTRLAAVEVSGSQDLFKIWNWNATVPYYDDACVHEKVAEVVRIQPEAPAICAWDGNLSYGELDLLSTTLACLLAGRGVGPNTLVPLCFSKSMWTTVAMLAVMKAGGASVLLDLGLPEGRLRTIVGQARGSTDHESIILSSAANKCLAIRLFDERATVVVDKELVEHIGLATGKTLLPLSSSSRLYVVFTSGSTGLPKGAVITHANFSSAIQSQRKAIGLSSSSRMYDFSSYSFDAAWFNVLHTLTSGACLCIPCDEERKDNLADSVAKFRATHLVLTPSTARLLDPSDLPCLQTLMLVGEPVSSSDVMSWSEHVDLCIGYGPAECSAMVTFLRCGRSGYREHSVGLGIGAVTWVVDQLRDDRLAPLGVPGELWLEGPLVGEGYLNDSQKTTAAFISDPPWLLRGGPGPEQLGRHGRLYKTGDLVRYSATSGSLVFLGRKDRQVKIRGQRIELGDVEHHVRQCIADAKVQVVAEVITPRESNGEMLVVFLAFGDADLQNVVSGFEKLASQLPAYMIPSVYLRVENIATTASDKIDRRELRRLYNLMTLEQLTASNLVRREQRTPTMEMELQLQELWSIVLRIEKESIGANDSFLQIGGDSIVAMQLVGAARRQGLSLTVADIFLHPRLCELAKTVKRHGVVHGLHQIPEPFSLLKKGTDRSKVCADAARLCGLRSDQIEDIFPCTPLQEGLIALTKKRPGDYVSRSVFELEDTVDDQRFHAVWEHVVASSPILRTRIVGIPGQGLVQVVVKEEMSWTYGSKLKAQQPMGEGTRLTQFGFSTDEAEDGKRHFVWTLHHALYDGWSRPMLLEQVEKMYTNQLRGPGDTMSRAPFQSFVEYVICLDRQRAVKYWQSQLKDCEALAFPVLPSLGYQPQARSKVIHSTQRLPWPGSDITASTMVRTAWILLLASYTQTADVLFGATVSGRQAAVFGIEEMMGPTIATVPVRVAFDWNHSVNSLLHQIQVQATGMTEFEQAGLQHIRRMGQDLKEATNFQALLVVQPIMQTKSEDSVLFKNENGEEDGGNALGAFNSYALMLVCQLDHDAVHLSFSFDSNVIQREQVQRMAAQLDQVLFQLCAAERWEEPIANIEMTSQQDLDDIWTWNAAVPDTVDCCVHDLIYERGMKQLDAPAVSAWDGELTYRQLDEVSMQLAYHLVTLGVKAGSVVPLCFEKSMWMPVAAIAVMKAGGASVLMDSNQPEERLRVIVRQVEPVLILSSSKNKILASRLADVRIVPVDNTEVRKLNVLKGDRLPRATAHDLLYVVFTSGSTGTPKGVSVSHSNFASALAHQTTAFDVGQGSRVFDFTSYSFDFAWSNLLNTLCAGACLCIPSEEDRTDDLTRSLAESKSSFVFLTPSVSNMVDPHSVPLLRTVALGGEKAETDHIERWPRDKRMLNIYGPAECAQAVTVAPFTNDTACVGHSLGLVSWIVDSSFPDRLSPIGAPGELWLEGPLVSQGYFNDPQKTVACFVEDPLWLLRGATSRPGRHGRLYKTGDLVQYNSDGSLVFLGRKDSMVKVRGQRVELGEVEHHVRQKTGSASVVAEVIVPSGSNNTTLVVFVNADKAAVDIIAFGLRHTLASYLPTYMVPSAFIQIDNIPMTPTGKTDRRRLRELGSTLTLEQLASLDTSRADSWRMPATDMEFRLQELWSEVLNVDHESIGAEDSFLQIGGDSITAMRLVSALRDQHLVLTMAEVLQTPTLSAMACMIRETTEIADDRIIPFSLMPDSIDVANLRSQAATACEVEPGQVEDVFPCSPLQNSLLASTTTRAGSYVSHVALELQPKIDYLRFQEAWEETVRVLPILRTRIVDLQGLGLVQVVIDRRTRWDKNSSLEAVAAQNDNKSMHLGSELTWQSIVHSHETEKTYFAWSIHHALYDGWSLPLMLNAAEAFYKELEPPRIVPFQGFIRHVTSIDDQLATSFWRDQLESSLVQVFPVIPTLSNRPLANRVLAFDLTGFDWGATNFTASTMIRAAWALIQASHTSSTDIAFGAVSSGRQATVTGLEYMAAPTIATVPIRIQFDREKTVEQLLAQVQQQALAMIPFEQIGLQRIRRLGDGADRACQFQTMLVVQPEGQDELGCSLFVDRDRTQPRASVQNEYLDPQTADNRLNLFNSYALMLECQPQRRGMKLRVSFDTTIIDPEQVERLVRQLEHTLRQLCSHEQQKNCVAMVQTVSEQDLDDIWTWNRTVPETIDKCIHNQIREVARRQPDAPAVCAWDGTLTYQQLDDFSSRLARYLVSLGVVPGVIVPLCFEKSVWMSVAAFGVMKAGGASTAMDTTQPKERLRAVVTQVSPFLVISSVLHERLAIELLPSQIIVMVDGDRLAALDALSSTLLPTINPSDNLYVVFTSGSTGIPKGAMVTHSNFSSAIHHQQVALGYRSDSRVYDFASYAFDVSWSNMLQTFSVGGCLCVPSEDDRRNNIEESIRSLEANYANLTPTVVRLLDSSRVPGLKVLQCAGEELRPADLVQWEGKLQIYNAYGPAECSVITTAGRVSRLTANEICIGKGLGCKTWVVQLQTEDELAPVGAIGELWLEGPLVGAGYHNDPEKTAESFISDPPWLLRGAAKCPGRHGRLYKSGDLVRYNTDGSLTYVGRRDAQVKIHGQRVELSEIEYHICSYLDTDKEVQVVVEMVTVHGRAAQVLMAFLSIAGTEKGSDGFLKTMTARITRHLDEALAAVLPSYMIPKAYVPVAKLPMTATGKTDRRRLREMARSMSWENLTSTERYRHVYPCNDREASILDVWSQVLNLQRGEISTDALFTRLGGDSISAMQVVSRCRARQISTTVGDVLRSQTIQKLALCSKSSSGLAARQTSKEDESSSWTLSPIQQMFFESHPNGLNHYNQAFLLRVRSRIEANALPVALGAVVARHPLLSARFLRAIDGGCWEQFIPASGLSTFEVKSHFVRARGEVYELAKQRQLSLDITHGPVFAADLFSIPNEPQALLLTAHHLVVDLVSWRIIWHDLQHFLLPNSVVMPTQTSLSFRKWCKIQEQHSCNLMPADVLPFEVGVPCYDFWGLAGVHTNNKGDAVSQYKCLTPELTTLLLGSCNEYLRTEPIDILVAALIFAFGQVFPERNVPAIYLEGHGREPIGDIEVDLSETVGWFTTFCPLQIPCKANGNVMEILKNVKDLRRSIPGKGRPFFAARYLSRSFQDDHSLAEVAFNYMGIYQQLESSDSIFERDDRFGVDFNLSAISDDARRHALVEVGAEVQHGNLHFAMGSHRKMQHQDRLTKWFSLWVETLMRMIAELADHAP